MEIDKSSKSNAVIGLGGEGTNIVNSLRETHPSGAQYLTLDIGSDIFGWLFLRRYSKEVVPPIEAWAIEQGPSITNWFSVEAYYHPWISEYFYQTTRRPVMRASLLMWRAKVAHHIKSVLTNPDVIVLTTCTGGSTGSAWIGDVARIAKEVFPEALIRIVLHDGLKSERYLDDYFVQKMLINSFWTLRELGADEHLSRCTAVTESTVLATELIAGMINDDGDFVSKVDEAELVDQVADVARQIYSKKDDFMGAEQFISGRCYSLSEILSENEWNAQAGLLLASAENRLTRQDSNSSYGWNEIKFYSRSDNDLLEIFSPRMRSVVGQDYVALALCHQKLGSDEHSHAYQTLSEEGACVLSGSGNPISADAFNQLVGMKLKIQERLNQSLEQKSPSSGYQFVNDFYPKLSELIDRLLLCNQMPQSKNLDSEPDT